MTRTRIRALIRKRLGETTASFWTDAELNDWINDSMNDVAYETKCIKANGKIDTTAASTYTVSSSFSNYIAVNEVYIYQDGDTWVKLKKTTRERLDRESTGWKSAESSVPQQYYWTLDEDIIGLYPKPNSDNQGTEYLEVYYSNNSTDMSSDSETPTKISYPLQLAMIDFVVATGFETRGYGEKANDAWGKYGRRIQKYMIERDKEAMVDDELVMKNERNL